MSHPLRGRELATSRSSSPTRSPHLQSPPKVVVFEDVRPMLDLYLEHLGKVPYIRVPDRGTVRNVRKAMLIFSQERPQIVVSDLQLTRRGTEGFQILKKIHEESPSTIVVLSTAAYDPAIENNSMNAVIEKQGFDAVFRKCDVLQLAKYVELKAKELLTH